jgi:hypothetical protein
MKLTGSATPKQPRPLQLIPVFGGRGWRGGATKRLVHGVEYQAMSTAKEELIRLIEDQPDDSSHEEILRELAFAAMVERGIADSDAGRTISNEEMARRIESWRK